MNYQIFIRNLLFILTVNRDINPFLRSKQKMVLILNVISNISHHFVVFMIVLFLKTDCTHYLVPDNLSILILSLLIVSRSYNISDTCFWIPRWNGFISFIKPRIFQLLFKHYSSRWEILFLSDLIFSERSKFVFLRLTFFWFIIFLLLSSSFAHFNSNNQRYQLSRTTNLPFSKLEWSKFDENSTLFPNHPLHHLSSL